MQIGPTQAMPPKAAEVIKPAPVTSQKVEPVKEAPEAVAQAKQVQVAATAAQIDRTFELSKDPPTTILKFTDARTKEVVLQIPSAESIKAYKDIQRYLKQQDEVKQALTDASA